MHGCVSKIVALLQAFGFERWLVRACKCAAMWDGVSFFLLFAGGKKKQNKFIQICTVLSKS
jgi:hypothetical protein